MPSTADPLPLQLYLHDQTPSDHFFALSNGHVPWVNSHREVSARDCIDAVERAIATGRYHNRGVEELVGGLKGLSYAETALPASTHLASLTLLKDDPRLRNRLVSSGPPISRILLGFGKPRTFATSNSSWDYDDSAEGSDTCTSSALSLREALATAAAAVAAQERKPPSTLPQAPDPLIFATIRQVLSSNPSYAEDVIFAVGQLPQDKRSLLFLADTECVGRSASGQPKSSEGSSKKRQRCSGGPSNESDNIGKPPAGRSGGSEKGKDGGCGENAGGGGSGRSGGGGTPPAKKTRQDKNRCWICPYSLAYPSINEIASFKYCRSPGDMTEVHLWRSHLVKHHSPGARNVGSRATDHAQFYMDSRQTEDVQAKIRSYKRRPRNWDDWHSYWKALFIEVWYIIFPKEHFPDLREPRSPFHLTSDEYADLGRIAKVMFEAIHDTEADRAVRANIVVSKQDFCPTRDEVLDMMSKALEIVLHDSPSAVGASQWLTQSTPEALQAAVAAQYNAPEPQPGTAMAASHGTEREIDIQEFVARPLLAIGPLMREFAPFTPSALQAVPPIWPDCYSTLSSNDTFAAINMKLTPTILQLLQARFQEGDQDFTLPVNFRVTITNETLFTAPVMAIMAEIDQLDTESTLGNSLPSSPQLSLMQGISMRMVQMKPLSREEHELSHTGNIPGSETFEM